MCRNCERRGRSDEANEELVNEVLAKSELKATLGLEVWEREGGQASRKRCTHARSMGAREAVGHTYKLHTAQTAHTGQASHSRGSHDRI